MSRFVLLLCLSFAGLGYAGDDGKKIYDPTADAQKQLDQTIAAATKSKKHVLVIIGGNWCSWCKKLDRLLTSNTAVQDALHANYELVHINYSPENKNQAVLAKLEYPQRFGFPVLLVLDGKGRRLHTQDSNYLEEENGYSPKKAISFLKDWSPEALNPDTYKDE